MNLWSRYQFSANIIPAGGQELIGGGCLWALRTPESRSRISIQPQGMLAILMQASQSCVKCSLKYLKKKSQLENESLLCHSHPVSSAQLPFRVVMRKCGRE